MNNEKRLLATLGIVLGILTLWSVLSPPPKEAKKDLPGSQSQPELAMPSAEATEVDPGRHFKLGPFDFEIGEKHAGIQGITVDDATLLQRAQPGVLFIEQIEPAVASISLQTRQEGNSILSEGYLDGLSVWREISLASEKSPYLLNCRIVMQNSSQNPEKTQLRLVAYRPLHAQHHSDLQFLHGSALVGGKLEKLVARYGRPKQYGQTPSWIGSQGKSHALILKPEEPEGTFHVEQSQQGVTVGWVELPREVLDPGEEAAWTFQIYAGPMAVKALREAGVEEAISFGTFSGVTKLLLRFLSWSNSWLHNYGLAICFLSLAVWLPFAPLTYMGMRMSSQTMQKMAALKPQEERIRREHKSNPQQAQKELMELYRKHKVNPASGCIGCLPFLFTWPVYIGLFQVLNRAPELRGAEFLWIGDLSAPDKLIRFPMEIPILGDGLNILPILATAATYVQQKAMQPAVAATDEQKTQQQMMKIFPIILLVFFYNLPSGFMLYWVVNGALMAGQQLMAKRVQVSKK